MGELQRWTERQKAIDRGASEAEATAIYGRPDWVEPDPELRRLGETLDEQTENTEAD
jgi:hypothetical protein